MKLRRTQMADLETFFEFQTDAEANHLAAFTAKDPMDKEAYLAKYSKFVDEPTINMQTIIIGHAIAGSISKFEIEGDAHITYWIDKKFWGKGIATAALKELLAMEKKRPVFAGAAFDNYGSQKVLEKCGFVRNGADRGFANGRGTEIEEFHYILNH